jgi:hypothetical protein
MHWRSRGREGENLKELKSQERIGTTCWSKIWQMGARILVRINTLKVRVLFVHLMDL